MWYHLLIVVFLTEYICKYIHIIHCNIWLNATGMTHLKIKKSIWKKNTRLLTLFAYTSRSKECLKLEGQKKDNTTVFESRNGPKWRYSWYTAFGMWWHTVTHGRGSEGETGGVTSTLTPPRQVVYPALLTLMRTPRLPAVDWTDSTVDLNGLVRFGGRQNVVSARVPSRSARALQQEQGE